MSHVPARISTTPAQRRSPKAISPAATNVSTTPTTVTWFGVSGDRPSALMSASAWRRTQTSNRVVNTSHLHSLGRGREREACLVVDIDNFRSDDVPGVAPRLLERVFAQAGTQLGVARQDDQRSGQLAPVLRRHGDAVATRLEHR